MNATTIKTQTATIAGKAVTVETLLGTKHRQDIFYKVDGKVVTYNAFWDLAPKFKTKVN